MNLTSKIDEKKAAQEQTVRELHEAELESVVGGQLADDPDPGAKCFHWKNSSSSWGF